MATGSIFSWRRLIAAIVIIAILAVATDYGFGTNGTAIAAGALGAPPWIVLPVVYILSSAAFQYHALSSYELYQQGGHDLVVDHALTFNGWHAFEHGVFVTVVLAAITAAILFIPLKRSQELHL